MSDTVTVKVSSRHQISLTRRARRALNNRAGDRLIVDIQGNVIVLLRQPSDFVPFMAGLHKDVWRQVDTAVYLNEERAAWLEADESD
jgi:bifunctional DNA-binding transcriptional regulator/antitoxin component of YhaV-PrlF toxin-antitoxin module